MNKNIFRVLIVLQIGLSGVNLLGINKRVKDMLKYQESKDFLNEKVDISLDDEFFEEALNEAQKYFAQNDFKATYDELLSLNMGVAFNNNFQSRTDFGKNFLKMAYNLKVPNNQLPKILDVLIREIQGQNDEKGAKEKHDRQANPKKRLALGLKYLNQDEFVEMSLNLMLAYAHNVGNQVVIQEMEKLADCIKKDNDSKLVGLLETSCGKALPDVFKQMVTFAVDYNISSDDFISVLSKFAGHIEPMSDDSDSDED